MPLGKNALYDIGVTLGLVAQHKERGRDAVFFQHVQQVRGIYRWAVIKCEGAQVFTHGLIHDDVAVHHTRLYRLRHNANRKTKCRKPYALENKSHVLMPQQRIAQNRKPPLRRRVHGCLSARKARKQRSSAICTVLKEV